eukprot:4572143-Prymnesium_polylepis.1
MTFGRASSRFGAPRCHGVSKQSPPALNVSRPHAAKLTLQQAFFRRDADAALHSDGERQDGDGERGAPLAATGGEEHGDARDVKVRATVPRMHQPRVRPAAQQSRGRCDLVLEPFRELHLGPLPQRPAGQGDEQPCGAPECRRLPAAIRKEQAQPERRPRDGRRRGGRGEQRLLRLREAPDTIKDEAQQVRVVDGRGQLRGRRRDVQVEEEEDERAQQR